MAVYDDPAAFGAAITPHDTNNLGTPTRGIYVGVAGNIKLITTGGSTITLVGVAAGTIVPVRATRVYDTDTTATSLVALW